jgi:catechol 2,3-dioxygenase-like lactoylglutathione lyase family enzyme
MMQTMTRSGLKFGFPDPTSFDTRPIGQITTVSVSENSALPLALDHLTIVSRSEEAGVAFYGLLLPHLGFSRVKPGIWRNPSGLYLQFRTAADGTHDYERYGPGLNHLGFAAPSPAFVESLHQTVTAAGYVARLQRFGDGTVALFLPDPDGLRVEVSYYPEGVPPVD